MHMKTLPRFLGYWLATAVTAMAAGTVLQVENGQNEQFQAVASVPLHTALPASFSLVEVGASGERLGAVACVVDGSGQTPELVCMLPGITEAGATRRLLVVPNQAPVPAATDLTVETAEKELVIRNSYFEIRHPRQGGGGLPSGVRFRLSGRADPDLYLLDRIYRRETKRQYLLSYDRESTATVVFQSPLRVVVETQARYCLGGEPAPGTPRAVYRFVYSPYSPVIGVTARLAKDDDDLWNEVHFLHLTRNDYLYTTFVTGDEAKVFPMNTPGEKSVSRNGSRWGVMATETDATGVGFGGVNCWDASDEFYYYVCRSRSQWTDRTMDWAGALYFGPAFADPAEYSRWLAGPSLAAKLVSADLTAAAPETVPPPTGAYELANEALRLVFAEV